MNQDACIVQNAVGQRVTIRKKSEMLMRDVQINDYITQRYGRWLDYAVYHCRIAGTHIEPAEVLNDVLCTILELDSNKLTEMLQSVCGKHTELDYFILHLLKVNIHSSRSKFRYTKGKHRTVSIEDSDVIIKSISNNEDDFDITHCYDIVRSTLSSLAVSEHSKQIFEWKFFEGRSFNEWQGRECRKSLYNTYNRILLMISVRIRRKIGD